MKQIFYKGLLALTIAFGVTSCDKNELDDIAAPTVGVVENDNYSKVSFDETGFGIQVPKLKGATNEASKTAGEFTHIYSTTPQVLVISDGTNDLYTGSYGAGDISSIVPEDIILANGSGYTASSSNASNGSTDVVSSFLPYTSAVDFDLSASASIRLQASLLRGFVIVNVEDAIEGSRVSGASVDGVSLLGPDTQGDYYGYLLAGPHSFTATYTLNDVATAVTASQEVVIGVAYTVTLDLVGEDSAVEGSTTSTETFNAIESELGQEGTGNDVNSDGDFLDSVRRIVTTIQPTLDGSPVGEADVMTPAWTVISDVDITTDTEESTEAAIVENINPGTDAGQDDDMFDTITRILTITTVYDADGTEVSSDSVPGVWTILEDRSDVTVGEDGTGTTTDTITYDVREYSAYGPAFGTQLGDFTQTRSVSNAEGSTFDPQVAVGELSRVIAVTNEVTLEAAIGVEGVTTYSATIDGEVETHDVAIDALPTPDPVYVARTYSEWGVAFVAQIANFTQTREVSNPNGNFDPALLVGELSREITVTGEVTTAAAPGVAGVMTYSADNGITFTHTTVIDALPALPASWEVIGGVHSNSDYAGYSFTISEEDQFDFSIRFVSNITVPSGSAAIVLGSEVDAAAAITAAKAAIVAAQ